MSDLSSEIPANGRVHRDGPLVICQIKGKAYLQQEPGVECVNPHAAEPERIYQKVFRHTPVYLPHEYDVAVANHLNILNRVVFGPNGYSALKPEEELAAGMHPGSYAFIVGKVLNVVHDHFIEMFPSANQVFVHGASASGVDLATSDFAEARGRPQLGFSCPQYLFYVRDNGRPVHVSPSIEEYGDAFGRTSDILLAMNGRKHSYDIDYSSMVRHHKYFVAINIMQMISTNGGPPDRDADGKINDAVAHAQRRMHFVNADYVRRQGRGTWENAMENLRETITLVCRDLLPARVAYEKG